MARISIIIASTTLLFFGLLHLHGTFYSTDLHPADPDLIFSLKSSHIKMDESGNLWKLWIGFNAMFSIGLLFIGSVNIYLSAKHFELLTRSYFVLFLTIASNAAFVWIGQQFIIVDFVISMFIPLLLYCIGVTLILLKVYHPSHQ